MVMILPISKRTALKNFSFAHGHSDAARARERRKAAPDPRAASCSDAQRPCPLHCAAPHASTSAKNCATVSCRSSNRHAQDHGVLFGLLQVGDLTLQVGDLTLRCLSRRPPATTARRRRSRLGSSSGSAYNVSRIALGNRASAAPYQLCTHVAHRAHPRPNRVGIDIRKPQWACLV